MSEQNKRTIKGLHQKDLTNIKFASALLDMAIEEKNDDLDFALQQARLKRLCRNIRSSRQKYRHELTKLESQ